MGNKTYILISKATFANIVDENMLVRDKLKSKTNTTNKTSVKLFESHHGWKFDDEGKTNHLYLIKWCKETTPDEKLLNNFNWLDS